MARTTAERLSDVAKTALLRDAIRDLHAQDDGNGAHSPLSAAWALLDEVANVAGWPGGYADVLAMHLWPSRATLIGYEIKASRSDLVREIEKLAAGKAERFAQYCVEWRLVAWDRRWLDGEKAVPGIPAAWGLYAYEEGKLARVRAGEKRRTPEALPYPFVAALVRRAVESGCGAGVLNRHTARAYEEGKRDGTRSALDSARAKLATPAVVKAWRKWAGSLYGYPTLDHLIDYLPTLAPTDDA